MTKFNYIGGELSLFERAKNWKKYWAHSIDKYIFGHVLEVGAGIGANIDLFINKSCSQWLAVEPDPNLSMIISRKFLNPIYCNYKLITGTLKQVDPSSKFDAVLYIDVLEHIEHDALELEMAGERVKIGGRIIVLAPAHNYLFTEFDRKIGHYRRYNKKMMKDVIPKNFAVEKLYYLDCIGFFASLANKLFLRSEVPTFRQIIFWDSILVPISKYFDLLTFNKFGKTIICVMIKKA